MPETEKRDQKVAANARHIEEAAEHLEHSADEDSTGPSRIEKSGSEAEPVSDEDEHDEEDESPAEVRQLDGGRERGVRRE